MCGIRMPLLTTPEAPSAYKHTLAQDNTTRNFIEEIGAYPDEVVNPNVVQDVRKLRIAYQKIIVSTQLSPGTKCRCNFAWNKENAKFAPTKICAEISCDEACVMAISVAGDEARQTALRAPVGRDALTFVDLLRANDEWMGDTGENAWALMMPAAKSHRASADEEFLIFSATFKKWFDHIRRPVCPEATNISLLRMPEPGPPSEAEPLVNGIPVRGMPIA
jgi:hypothetical protein